MRLKVDTAVPEKTKTKKKKKHAAGTLMGCCCCCCWESKLNRRPGSRTFNLSLPHRFAVIHHEPRDIQSFRTRTPNNTLLKSTLVQWTSSLHQVGVSEVGRIAPLNIGKLAGSLVYMLDVCANNEYLNEPENRPTVCLCVTEVVVSWFLFLGEVGIQLTHFTGTHCPAQHRCYLSTCGLFVFSPVTKRWTLPDRNAERR